MDVEKALEDALKKFAKYSENPDSIPDTGGYETFHADVEKANALINLGIEKKWTPNDLIHAIQNAFAYIAATHVPPEEFKAFIEQKAMIMYGMMLFYHKINEETNGNVERSD